MVKKVQDRNVATPLELYVKHVSNRIEFDLIVRFSVLFTLALSGGNEWNEQMLLILKQIKGKVCLLFSEKR